MENREKIGDSSCSPMLLKIVKFNFSLDGESRVFVCPDCIIIPEAAVHTPHIKKQTSKRSALIDIKIEEINQTHEI